MGDDFKIITTKKGKGKDHLFTGSKLNIDYFKSLSETLQNAKDIGISTGLLINYSGGKLENLGKRQFLNQVMKIVKKLALPIVPIRLDADIHPFFQSGFRAKLLKRTKQEPIEVKVRIGKPITLEEQQKFIKNSQFRKFVQSK